MQRHHLMFLVFNIVALCLCVCVCVWTAACPQWLVPAPTTPERMGAGGGAGCTASRPPGASPVTPGAGVGGNVGGSCPDGLPLGPLPLPGRRVSRRPQPTRAPRDEVMALRQSRGGGGGGLRPGQWQGAPLHSGVVAVW